MAKWKAWEADTPQCTHCGTPLLQVMDGMAIKNKQQFTLGNYHVQKNGCVIDGKNNHIFLRLL